MVFFYFTFFISQIYERKLTNWILFIILFIFVFVCKNFSQVLPNFPSIADFSFSALIFLSDFSVTPGIKTHLSLLLLRKKMVFFFVKEFVIAVRLLEKSLFSLNPLISFVESEMNIFFGLTESEMESI